MREKRHSQESAGQYWKSPGTCSWYPCDYFPQQSPRDEMRKVLDMGALWLGRGPVMWECVVSNGREQECLEDLNIIWKLHQSERGLWVLLQYRNLSLTLISWVLSFSVGFVLYPLAHAAAIPGASFCVPERVSRDIQVIGMHDQRRFSFLHVAGVTKVMEFFPLCHF